MSYQAQFLRKDAFVEKSELFETFHEAHVFAAQEVAKRKPTVVVIVEIDNDGTPGRIHELQVL